MKEILSLLYTEIVKQDMRIQKLDIVAQKEEWQAACKKYDDLVKAHNIISQHS